MRPVENGWHLEPVIVVTFATLGWDAINCMGFWGTI